VIVANHLYRHTQRVALQVPFNQFSVIGVQVQVILFCLPGDAQCAPRHVS